MKQLSPSEPTTPRTDKKMHTASLHYARIEKAIKYITAHANEQPSLQSIADVVHLSPHHFQRLFSEWAGVSPKKFMQFISVNHAKSLLKSQQTLETTSDAVGLSGSSRLHDLFVNIEGMTPGEYKQGGERLVITYQLSASPFGQVAIAATEKGVCFLRFVNDEPDAIQQLSTEFPAATLRHGRHAHHDSALQIFSKDWSQLSTIKLHLKATPFQLQVWQALLSIPSGDLCSYQHIASHINRPTSARAVGTAIGKNPIAYLIPCHRVIQASGQTTGYRWGSERKSAIIGWEAAQRFIQNA